MTQPVVGHAYARVGLLGNPSDGYGGRVISMTVSSMSATVELRSAQEWDFGNTELLAATVEAVGSAWPALVQAPGRFTFETTIPRQVGLSGSSAIIIAALRALASRSGETWDPVELAKVALATEVDVLGWAAGPQDRVVQAFEGLVDMDFATPWHAPSYQQLATDMLPPLFLAWNQATGESSDVAHSGVRERWAAGDELVVRAMQRFAELAVEGRASLDAGQAAVDWPALLDEAFELRRRFWNITEIDTMLIETGRAAGAGVAFAGSGGAVVGAVSDSATLPILAAAYDQVGAGFEILTA